MQDLTESPANPAFSLRVATNENEKVREKLVNDKAILHEKSPVNMAFCHLE